MSAARRPSVRTIPTPVGPARATLHRPPFGTAARSSLVLGHGAGGSGPSRDLAALTALTQDGWVVVLVDQPWRVAGRRVATPPPQLDVAWAACWRALVGRPAAERGERAEPAEPAAGADSGRRLPGPRIAGGRSAGARVVARTAKDLRPDGLLLLSFPLEPPARGDKPRPSRSDELAAARAADMPLLLVQGRTDSFGRPERLAQAAGLDVVPVRGGHGFAGDAADVRAAVADWLDATWPAPVGGD